MYDGLTSDLHAIDYMNEFGAVVSITLLDVLG